MGARQKWGGAKANYVCEKHGFNKKGHGVCPICREELVCLGTRWRIGRHGNFKKKERKTRKLAGQKFPFGSGPTSRSGSRHRELMAKWREENIRLGKVLIRKV